MRRSVLRSHITLELAVGSVLLGSPEHDDYPEKTEFRSPGRQSLVSATDAEDVAVTGSGVIDGNGESWWIEARRYKDAGILGSEHTRPRLVVFDHCHHVRVEGVTLQNSPMWQLVPRTTPMMSSSVTSGARAGEVAKYGRHRSILKQQCGDRSCLRGCRR